MTRRLFQDSTMMQNTRQVAVRYVAIDAAGFQHFQVVQREKAAIGTHLSWWLATFPVHFVHHRYQQPIVVQFPADLLGHDQMKLPHLYVCLERDLFTGVGQVTLAWRPSRTEAAGDASLFGDRPPALHKRHAATSGYATRATYSKEPASEGGRYKNRDLNRGQRCLAFSFCGRGESVRGRWRRRFGSCSSDFPGVCGG